MLEIGVANYALQASSLHDAMTSIDRASGAMQAGVLACVALQHQQAVADAQRADAAMAARPALYKTLFAQLRAAGIHAAPASLLQAALNHVHAHGIDKPTDAMFRKIFGKQANAVEARIAHQVTTGQLRAVKVEVIASLSSFLPEPPFPATSFAQASIGAGVTADPTACASH